MEIIKQIKESCEYTHNERSERGIYPPDGVTSRIHDGALVCSGHKHITGDIEQVKSCLEKELGALDSWVEEQEGITGHIKAIVSVDGPVYKISATAGEVETTDLGLKNIHVSIVAIVFQVDRETMEKRIESLIERLLSNNR